MEEDDESGKYYTKTPLSKRLPTMGALLLGFILAQLLGHTLWTGILILIGTWIVCVLILHLVFRQPLERLLQYKEFHDD